MIDVYNKKSLEEAISKCSTEYHDDIVCDKLLFIPEQDENEDGYISAKRYAIIGDTIKYMGKTDFMPTTSLGWLPTEVQMDFCSGGIQLFCHGHKLICDCCCFTATVIEII